MAGLPRFADARAVAEALRPSYPVYCLAPEELGRAARVFLDAFPGRVLYAVKCNPHPRVLRALHEAGVRHFDTASLPEIAGVREAHPDGVSYFMHPVKSPAAVRTAHEVYGVRHYVVDHPDELAKVLDATGGGEGLTVLVRLKTPETRALFNLAAKFGAPPELAASLLGEVAGRGLRSGLAFHVGSQCLEPGAFASAIALAGEVAAAAAVDLAYLDVGGGFPAPYPGQPVPGLESFLDAVRDGVRRIGLRNDCVLMCEPGRALVASGCSLLVQIQLRKANEVYINDGIFGSLSEPALTGIARPLRLIRLEGEPAARRAPFKVYGPTCDSTDVLPRPFDLPEDAREGDWLEIGMMGAYSNALATHFNGFHPDTFVEVDRVLGGETRGGAGGTGL